MTPAQFADFARPTAEGVSDGTGIDTVCLMAQWANETQWGVSFAGRNNFGNIMDRGRSIDYSSLNAFAIACIQTWHNGYYQKVLNENGSDPRVQLKAICDSPWAAGHYGGSLEGFYAPLEDFELNSNERAQLYFIYRSLQGTVDGNIVDPASMLERVKDVQSKITTPVAATLDPAQAASLAEIQKRVDKDLAP